MVERGGVRGGYSLRSRSLDHIELDPVTNVHSSISQIVQMQQENEIETNEILSRISAHGTFINNTRQLFTGQIVSLVYYGTMHS